MRTLKWFGISLVLSVVALLAALHLFGDPIARRVVSAVTARYPTRVEVGTYDLSLFRSFPRLSVDLHRVRVQGSDGSELLTAARVGCLIPLRSLFGETTIEALRIADGRLHLITDADGNTNYQLAGYESVGDRTDAAAEEAAFAIREARLSNVELHYDDRQLSTDLLLTIPSGTFDGEFGTEQYELSTDAELLIHRFSQEGTVYLADRPLTVAGRIGIDRTRESYRLTDLQLSAGKLTFQTDGTVQSTGEGVDLALSLTGSASDLDDVLSLLPPSVTGPVRELETSGTANFTATVEGEWSATGYPRIIGDLTFSEGKIGSPRTNLGARDIELAARFDYLATGRSGTQSILIDRLTGTFRGEPFQFRLELLDLDDPRVEVSANGTFPLETLPGVITLPQEWQPDGTLYVTNFRLRGKWADMQDPRRMQRVETAGIVEVADVSLRGGDQALTLPSGILKLADNRVMVENLRVRTPRSDFTLTGAAENYLPVLLADSLNTRDASLKFSGTLTGNSLDVGEIMNLTNDDESTPSPESVVTQRARITDLLDGDFRAELDRWSWDELHGEAFRGQLDCYRGQLEVRGITDAMDGEWRVDASTFFRSTTHSSVKLTARKVDAPTFFRQLQNFDQEILTDRHLRGTLNADLLLELYYDEAGAFDYERFTAQAGIEVLDGELRDFPMLENFAFALKTDDLKRVRFTRLSNYFEILDRTIYIPAMFIQSSAINLTLSGNHTFDQDLEYYVRVNAGQVLANKLSRHDRELKPLPARNGLFNLYYTIDGPLESYRVETDKSAVLTDFRRSTYRRDRIRSRLAQAFQRPIQLLDDNDAQNDTAEGADR